MRRLPRVVRIVVMLALMASGLGLVAPAASAATSINGEGSNFTLTAMQQWIGNFPNVNYQGIGSPAGLNQFFPPQGPQAAEPIHFVETDIPYTSGQLSTHQDYPPGPVSSGGKWSYVPIAAGGIGFAYHLHDANGQPVGTLRLNQLAIADIMTFAITNWNDPYLVALNPGVALPNEKIHLVVDSTASGQTYLLSQYFLSNPAAATLYSAYTHDTLPQANWGALENSGNGPVVGPCSPQCIAEAGPSAQAEYVSQSSSEGSIAYVPTAYAVSDGEPVAAVQNFAGNYTLPSHDDVTAALDSAYNPNGGSAFDGFEQIDWNAPAPTAYAISTYSYMLTWLAIEPTIPGLSQDEADAVAAFGEWAITTGQQNAYNIGYAPISNVLIAFGLATYESIPGAAQGVTIPCIPGSEGSKCNQDPPGPCLGGGETAGNPGNCPSGTHTAPPTALPPAPGTPGTPAPKTPSKVGSKPVATPASGTPAASSASPSSGPTGGSPAAAGTGGPTNAASASSPSGSATGVVASGGATSASQTAGGTRSNGTSILGLSAPIAERSAGANPATAAAGQRALQAESLTVLGRGTEAGDRRHVNQAIPAVLASLVLAPGAAEISLLLALGALGCLVWARRRTRAKMGTRR